MAEDPAFERDGNDLHTQVTIDVFKAILGGEVEVRTLAGKVLLTIPPGTQPEQVFRLAGRGMPVLKDPGVKGDLYVLVKVQIPKGLNARQKSLLEQASNSNNRPRLFCDEMAYTNPELPGSSWKADTWKWRNKMNKKVTLSLIAWF